MPEEKTLSETPQCIIDQQGDVLDLVYERPHTMTDTRLHFCPGCGHSTAHKLIAEVIQEMNIQSEVIGVAPVGCAVFAYDYLNIDWQEAAHGRATAVATGIKRCNPDKYVFTYQETATLLQSAQPKQYTV
jgi:Pyruvate:ferredoxin oxidoreductase and related 2-oxoacid:ferredoxin oxidoreductases, beta subunit